VQDKLGVFALGFEIFIHQILVESIQQHKYKEKQQKQEKLKLHRTCLHAHCLRWLASFKHNAAVHGKVTCCMNS